MNEDVETNWRGLPYRARRNEAPNADGSWTWLIEYKQAPTYGWGPRGRMTELPGGQFQWAGQVYPYAEAALRARARDL